MTTCKFNILQELGTLATWFTTQLLTLMPTLIILFRTFLHAFILLYVNITGHQFFMSTWQLFDNFNLTGSTSFMTFLLADSLVFLTHDSATYLFAQLEMFAITVTGQ